MSVIASSAGGSTKRNPFSLVILFLLAPILVSCSGPPKTGGGPGGRGTATLSLTLTATPLTPPENLSILSFSATISGILLTPATGSAVNIPPNSSSYVAEFTRLQSDSAFLASVSVPAGTYNSIEVMFSGAVVTFCTQPTSGISGCASGSLTQVTGAAAQPKATFSSALTLSANQSTGLQLQLNLANTITVSSTQPQVITKVDLTAANVLSVATPPTLKSSLASNQLDFVEDVAGVVSSVTSSSQTLTVMTATRGPITATANSSTVFSSSCGTSIGFTCVRQDSAANVDLALNANGTFTVLEYDPLPFNPSPPAALDVLEGVVTVKPSTSTQTQIVATDVTFASTNSVLNSKVNIGDPVNVTIALPAGSPGFFIDSKGVFVPSNTFEGSTDATVMVPGQTVALLLTRFTPKNGTTVATATVSSVALRFSRVTASVSSVSSPFVTISGFAPYLGIAASVQGEVKSGVTNYDGVTDATGLNAGGLQDTVSIRALYFGTMTVPPFSIAKLRKH
jgi:hypothetical protein